MANKNKIKVVTNVEIHQSTRNLAVVGTWGKANRFENKKRTLKADATGRKTRKHKGRDM